MCDAYDNNEIGFDVHETLKSFPNPIQFWTSETYEDFKILCQSNLVLDVDCNSQGQDVTRGKTSPKMSIWNWHTFPVDQNLRNVLLRMRVMHAHFAYFLVIARFPAGLEIISIL